MSSPGPPPPPPTRSKHRKPYLIEMNVFFDYQELNVFFDYQRISDGIGRFLCLSTNYPNEREYHGLLPACVLMRKAFDDHGVKG